ncbi:hypothetical protein DIPPA_58562 [Diplonema papillatum]|nr:hypothetical protein DIPPA_58562 [Diplonema papillatum]
MLHAAQKGPSLQGDRALDHLNVAGLRSSDLSLHRTVGLFVQKCGDDYVAFSDEAWRVAEVWSLRYCVVTRQEIYVIPHREAAKGEQGERIDLHSIAELMVPSGQCDGSNLVVVRGHGSDTAVSDIFWLLFKNAVAAEQFCVAVSSVISTVRVLRGTTASPMQTPQSSLTGYRTLVPSESCDSRAPFQPGCSLHEKFALGSDGKLQEKATASFDPCTPQQMTPVPVPVPSNCAQHCNQHCNLLPATVLDAKSSSELASVPVPGGAAHQEGPQDPKHKADRVSPLQTGSALDPCATVSHPHAASSASVRDGLNAFPLTTTNRKWSTTPSRCRGSSACAPVVSLLQQGIDLATTEHIADCKHRKPSNSASDERPADEFRMHDESDDDTSQKEHTLLNRTTQRSLTFAESLTLRPLPVAVGSPSTADQLSVLRPHDRKTTFVGEAAPTASPAFVDADTADGLQVATTQRSLTFNYSVGTRADAVVEPLSPRLSDPVATQRSLTFTESPQQTDEQATAQASPVDAVNVPHGKARIGEVAKTFMSKARTLSPVRTAHNDGDATKAMSESSETKDVLRTTPPPASPKTRCQFEAVGDSEKDCQSLDRSRGTTTSGLGPANSTVHSKPKELSQIIGSYQELSQNQRSRSREAMHGGSPLSTGSRSMGSTGSNSVYMQAKIRISKSREPPNGFRSPHLSDNQIPKTVSRGSSIRPRNRTMDKQPCAVSSGHPLPPPPCPSLSSSHSGTTFGSRTLTLSQQAEQSRLKTRCDLATPRQETTHVSSGRFPNGNVSGSISSPIPLEAASAAQRQRGDGWPHAVGERNPSGPKPLLQLLPAQRRVAFCDNVQTVDISAELSSIVTDNAWYHRAPMVGLVSRPVSPLPSTIASRYQPLSILVP